MDSNTAIGKVTSLVLKTIDVTSEQTVETTINKSLQINADATYGQVDSAMRSLATLGRNSYEDTICVTNISVNQVLAG